MVQEAGSAIHFRVSRRGDEGAIDELLAEAFAPSELEGSLVRAIREETKSSAIHEWVAMDPSDAQVLAYALFTPAFDGWEGDRIGLHLGPVAVFPSCQRQGIGSGLLRHALASESICQEVVYVLGDPNYYERLGFGAVPERYFCPYDPGNAHFRALRASPAGAAQPRRPIGYHRLFKELFGSG